MRLFTIAIIGMALLYSNSLFACDCPKQEPVDHIANTEIIAHSDILDARLLSKDEISETFADDASPFMDRIAIATLLIEKPLKGAKKGDKITVYYDVSF